MTPNIDRRTAMNLKLTLIFRIIGAASLCLLGAAAYILWQADQDLRRNMASTADSAARQLNRQLWHISAGFDLPERFPEWQSLPAESAAGLCVSFTPPDGGAGKSFCNGWSGVNSDAPRWFARLHGWAFGSSRETVRPIAFRDAPKGVVTVSANPASAAAQAWRDIRGLVGLQLASVMAVCAMIYVSVSRALQPAEAIVAGLARLEGGDLNVRLPPFQPAEFCKISQEFNRLVARLQSGIEERTCLTRRLFQVQEEERRALARDLHDEFGQCLAAIAALAASIVATAKQECPANLREGEAIGRICAHLMEMLRETLVRLRPPEIELGLIESLNSLVVGWNDRLAGTTRFAMEVSGDFGSLPGDVCVNVYRIVQEGLTNASKHAGASEVVVRLARACHGVDAVTLSVEDNGNSGVRSGAAGKGVGLLGMQERTAALGGTLSLELRQPSGMCVRAFLPVDGRRGGAEAEAS